MLYKSILKILEPGTDLDKRINFKTCAITLSIITVKQYYHDPKIQECGTLWEVATKKWIRTMKLKDAMLGLKAAKIVRV
jgi:hypothetical protein